MKAAGWRVSADRERWTVKSWRETEGEDIQIRRAKLLKCVLENIEINIHPFDEIVGRPTPWVIGCQTAIDVCGDYIPGIWEEAGSIDATLDASVNMSKDVEILRESARLFGSTSLPAMTYKAWRRWWEAGPRMPKPQSSRIRPLTRQTGQSTRPFLKKLLKGLKRLHKRMSQAY